MDASYTTVSVVIATKNEEKNLGSCLESIKKQSFPQKYIEIIVVDNNSTDRTKQIAKSFTNKVFNFGPERSAQRNYGAKKSLGQYYMYIDADMILDRHVIAQSVNKLKKDRELIALYIPEIVLGNSFWSKVRKFERAFYTGTVIDCVRIIKTKEFIKVGGFDESMSGPEDWDIDKKIGQIGKIDIIEAPIYHNETQFNLRKYINKKKYYIKSLTNYAKKWGENDIHIKKQLGFKYRFIGVFVENGKWKKILMHPFLTMGMFLLRFLVGIAYISRKK